MCWPFSVEGLHEMARVLGIARCWYHAGGDGRFPHYDVPKRRVAEMARRTEVVSPRVILAIIQGGSPPPPMPQR